MAGQASASVLGAAWILSFAVCGNSGGLARDSIKGVNGGERFKTIFRDGAVDRGIDLFYSPLGAENLHGACVLLPAFSRASVCRIRKISIFAALS